MVFVQDILDKLGDVDELYPKGMIYYRLIVLVAPSFAGKTAALLDVREQIGASYLNVSLELSQRLLELTARQRPLRVGRIMDRLLEQQGTEVVLLNHLELLFEPSLQQNPLQLLKGLSRNQTIIATWSGRFSEGHLIYAVPSHLEYGSYPAHDILVVAPDPLS